MRSRPRQTLAAIQWGSHAVLLAHHQAFKRAKNSITRADLRLARLYTGPDFDPGAPNAYFVPGNWIRGSSNKLVQFLHEWRADAYARLGIWTWIWCTICYVFDTRGDDNDDGAYARGYLRKYLGIRYGGMATMILAVSLALFWWTMYRDNTPRTTRTQVRNHGEESRPMPDISMARTTTTTTTTTTSMAFVEVPTVGKDCEDEESGAAQSTTKTPDAPPPLPGRETAIACSLSADLAQLNQQDPSLVSLYDLSQLPLLVLFHGTSTLPPSYISLLSPGTQARSSNSKNKTKKKQGGKSKAAEEARIVLAAENIPQAVLVQGFASAINERWRELEMACGGGRGGTGTGIRKSSDSDDDMLLKPTLDVTMNNSTQSAGTGVGARDDNSKDVSHRRYYKKRDDGDARYGNARHGENRNREDAPLCLSLEGRSLHKRHELTIKTAAFLTNPAHRKLYNAKFQRRVEALRVLQTQEQGRERDRRGDKTASASCDDKKYDIYGGKEGNKRIRKKAHDTTGKTGGYLGRLWNTGGSSGNADVGNGNERRDGEGSSQVNGGHRRDLDEANPPFEEVCAGVV